MTHAPRGGRRLFTSSLYDGASPIGALTVRDDLLNNALHAADEANAKCLVNWMAPVSSLVSGSPQLYLAGDMEVTDEWYRMESYGPFGLSVFADRTPYQIVVEVYAKASAASATSILIQIAPSVLPGPTELESGDNMLKFTTSSTALGWLTALSGANIITPTEPAFLPERPRATTDVEDTSISRALASNAAAGATSLLFVAGMPAAPYVATITDGVQTELVNVTAVAGGNITISPGLVNSYVAGPTTITRDYNGEAREVLQCEFYVNVYGVGTVAVAEPQIHGMLIREYVGK